MVRASRLALICFLVILVCPSVNVVLRRVLPTMSPGFLTGILWILTDVNRLLVLAALGGLVASAVWAIRRSSRLPPKPAGVAGKRNPPLGIKIITFWLSLLAAYGVVLGFIRLGFRERPPSFGLIGLYVVVMATIILLLGAVAVGLWKLKGWAWWSALVLCTFILILTGFQLLPLHFFPNPWHEWRFYLYLALLVYLLRSSIRRRFTHKP